MLKKQIVLVILFWFLAYCANEPGEQQQTRQQQITQQQTQNIQQSPTVPTYNQDIKPIFDQNCVSCHRAGGQASSYPLDSYQNIMNGRTNCTSTTEKRYIVPSNSNSSYLYKKIIGTQDMCGGKMPPSGNLPQDKIELIKKWIDAGAPESSASTNSGGTSGESGSGSTSGGNSGSSSDTTSGGSSGSSDGSSDGTSGGTSGGSSGGTSGSSSGGSGGGGGKTPPAVFGKYIYTVSEEGKIIRWDGSRKEIFFDIGSNTRIVSPSIDEYGNLYFSAWDGHTYSIDNNGNLRWKIHFGKCDGVSIHDNIFFGCENGVLYELTKDGYIIHSIFLGGPIVSAPLILQDGKAVIGSDNGKIYEIKDGKVLKSFETNGKIRETPAIDKNSNIYFGSYDTYIYSISPDFKIRWKFKTGGGIYSGCSLWEKSGKTVCTIGSKDGYTYTVDENGNLVWKVQTGDVSTVPLIGIKNIYVLSDDNEIFAISKEGIIISRYKTEPTYYSSPAIAFGEVVVSTELGEILKFGFQDELLPGWTTARGNLQRTGGLK